MWYIEQMFDHEKVSIDTLEQRLLADEAEISRRRFRQCQTLRLMEAAQVATMDGSRSMTEWVSSRLDVGPQTARDLLRLSRGMERSETARDLASGLISFERTAAEARLSELGASPEVVTNSRGLDLSGVWRLVARHRKISRAEEHRTFSERYLALQPNLDASSWRLWGELPGTDGAVVEQALHHRGDRLPHPPLGEGASVSERNADALVSISLDSLTGTSEEGEVKDHTSGQITVFVEASLAAASGWRSRAGGGGRAPDRTGGPRGVALQRTSGLHPDPGRGSPGGGKKQPGDPASVTSLRDLPRRRLCHRGLWFPLPAPGPPCPPLLRGRKDRGRQSHHFVLAPPSRGHPWLRLPDRSGQSARKAEVPPSRSRSLRPTQSLFLSTL